MNDISALYDFLQKWGKRVLYAGEESDVKELHYHSNRMRYFLESLKPLWSVLLVISIIAILLSNRTLSAYEVATLVLKFAGVGATSLLLYQSIDEDSGLLQKYGQKRSCSTILNSSAAEITSWLSWGEVGFFYFTSTLLFLAFSSNGQAIIALLSMTTLPYAIWSLSYQYRHKTWCRLCYIVQGILIAEFVAYLFLYGYLSSLFSWNFRWLDMAILLFSIILPILSWNLLKPIFEKAAKFEVLDRRLNQTKRDVVLFHELLKKQNYYPVNDDTTPIVLGNPDAEYAVTILSNPLCKPCAETHKQLEDWLLNGMDIRVNVLFAIRADDEPIKSSIVRHMLSLGVDGNKKTTEHALGEWYRQTEIDYASWARKFPSKVENRHKVEEFEHLQKQWCAKLEMVSTPTVPLNGYEIPAYYQLTDLRYIIEY